MKIGPLLRVSNLTEVSENEGAEMNQKTALHIWIALACFFGLWAIIATVALFLVAIE